MACRLVGAKPLSEPVLGYCMLIKPLGTNFSETFIEIHIFSFKKMPLNVSSAKCRPFCLGLNVLTTNVKHHNTRNKSLLMVPQVHG